MYTIQTIYILRVRSKTKYILTSRHHLHCIKKKCYLSCKFIVMGQIMLMYMGKLLIIPFGSDQQQNSVIIAFLAFSGIILDVLFKFDRHLENLL